MNENRVQDRRGQPATLSATIAAFLRKTGMLAEHPSTKAKEAYRDNTEARDRRNRRVRRNDSRASDRRTLNRRAA